MLIIIALSVGQAGGQEQTFEFVFADVDGSRGRGDVGGEVVYHFGFEDFRVDCGRSSLGMMVL